MNIIEEYSTDTIQEKQNFISFSIIKDPYIESQIPTFNIKNLKDLYDQIQIFDNSVENNDTKYMSSYFSKYSDYIQKTFFNENDSFEYVEFILPYIDKLMQINTCQEVLDHVLLSVYHIVLNSHYYSLKFVNSSFNQRLLSIIQANISDYITGISLNIFYLLSLYDEYRDICISTFPIQILFEYISSKDYYDFAKDGFINLIDLHLIGMTNDQTLYEIFSLILKHLLESNLTRNISLRLIALIGRYYFRNEGKTLDILPEKLKEFISGYFLEIAHTDSAIENDLFFLIHYLTNNGVEINYPVEEIYQLILSKEIANKTKEYIIGEIANSIKVKDDIEYSRKFITKSIKEIIEYAFEEGSIKFKTCSTILLGAILVTDNYEIFISILYSPSFIDFIYFITNSEVENTVIFGVGILENAFHYLQKTMPDSNEIKFLVSTLLSNNLSNCLSLITDHSEMAELLIGFYSLIEIEASRLSLNA